MRQYPLGKRAPKYRRPLRVGSGRARPGKFRVPVECRPRATRSRAHPDAVGQARPRHMNVQRRAGSPSALPTPHSTPHPPQSRAHHVQEQRDHSPLPLSRLRPASYGVHQGPDRAYTCNMAECSPGCLDCEGSLGGGCAQEAASAQAARESATSLCPVRVVDWDSRKPSMGRPSLVTSRYVYSAERMHP